MKTCIRVALVLSACVVGVPSVRGDVATAEAKFNSGLAHFKAQEYAAACADFRESEAQDPNSSTEYYLGKCAVQEQHPAQAWNFFKRAAAGLDDPKKRAAAEQAATDVLPRIGLVALVGTEPAPGLEVRIDSDVVTSQVLLGLPFAVEPGAHTLTATAPDRTTWRRDFTIAQGESLSFSVPSLPSGRTAEPSPPPGVEGDSAEERRRASKAPSASRDDLAHDGRSGRTTLTYVAFGVGATGVVTGAVSGVLAKRRWTDARRGCAMEAGAYVACPAGADELRAQASTRATISTSAFVVGGIGVATGLVLYFTQPKRRRAVAVIPVASPGDAGFALTGSF